MNLLEEDIGVLVCEHAHAIFKYCGAEDDFGTQCVGGVAVFGGCNRVLFNPDTGFRLDESYCSPEFISKFREYKALLNQGQSLL